MALARGMARVLVVVLGWLVDIQNEIVRVEHEEVELHSCNPTDDDQ